MEFLPLEVENERVYAGFWARFGASIVDMLVSLPLIFALQYLGTTSVPAAVTSAILTSLLFSIYVVYFHYRFGATLGKMAAGIQVTLPDGSRIGLKQALLRSSVDISFALLILLAQIIALLSVDPEVYFGLGFVDRAMFLIPLYPIWYSAISTLNQFWYWGEFLTLLFNKRKRALHDLIAGTVVIYRKFADNGVSKDSALAFDPSEPTAS